MPNDPVQNLVGIGACHWPLYFSMLTNWNVRDERIAGELGDDRKMKLVAWLSVKSFEPVKVEKGR